MKIASCFLLSLMWLHLTSCSPQCTVSMASLHCGEEQPGSQPSYKQQGLPGKRGASGTKGEKGESGNFHDVMAKFTRNTRRLDLIEEKLNPIKELCDKSEVESLKASLTTTKSELAEVLARVEALEQRSVPRSCRDVASGFQQRINGSYTIQPNGTVHPFTVYCSFEGSEVITAVGHDSEGETEVTCDGKRCYEKEIQYQATFPQMRSLIDLIGNCRQFVKYRCRGSLLFRNGDYLYAGWLSWNGVMQAYWGGADRRSNYCACGVAGNCAEPAHKCNCDKNDSDVEREDSGYLTYEDDLPVHTLYFGDAGDRGEYGFHTLGKLECMG